MSDQSDLITRIKACTICNDLPLGPKPIVQLSPEAKVLIAGQAPGQITHKKGVPFDDPSGDRLRDWLGINRETFYDATKLAVVPMGFCYPGTGKSGDLPPRIECAAQWREEVLASMTSLGLTIIIGRYAIDWHMPDMGKKTVTEVVKTWREHFPKRLILPHPSPRNNRWLKQNPWFEQEVIPQLQKRVKELI